MPQLSPSGGWICSNHSKYNGLGGISCFANFVFLLFLGPFGTSFLLILEVLGRHFGNQKVDSNFGRKTGMEGIPGIPANPGKSRDGGPNPLRTINKTSLGQQGPRRHSTSWLRHGGG